ncbi:MAG TPA: AbrB/MazE/SpoVT family DNA-binding domain-containing protein [Thermoanaerobaculia bacterium]|nr:AbrB/MazE/SpoVT family DNA-binding domain-containing protein [Thermoanaerobaculia bacterium]
MPTATVTSKGQITLPKSIRDRLQLDTGDQVDFVVNDRGDVVVRPITLDVTELRGLLKRSRKRAVSVEEMNAAIQRHHARKR